MTLPPDLLPVRFRDRWIDDGGPIELAGEDGVRFGVTVAWIGEDATPPVGVIAARTTGRGHHVAVRLDVATGVITDEVVAAGHPDGARDLAWLRARLDAPLRAALLQRLERTPHGTSGHDWTDGARPRVALGQRATYAELLPRAWDLVVALGGVRYAVIDTYKVSREASSKAVALEIVDLAAGAVVGRAEGTLGAAERAGWRSWRCAGERTAAVLDALTATDDRRDGLRLRAGDVEQIARLMATWDHDVQEPAGAVDTLIRQPLGLESLALGRVLALGARCVPALRAALDGADRAAAVVAAHALARLRDPAGLAVLVEALADPDPIRVDPVDAEAIIEALVVVRTRAVDPVISALTAARAPRAQDLLLEALLAIDGASARSRALALDLIRADPRRARLIAATRDDELVAALRDLAHEHLARVRADPDADTLFEATFALVRALRRLRGEEDGLRALQQLIEQRRARLLAKQAVLAPATPLHAAPATPPRPGRNDPCWCGSLRKFKKCCG